MNFLLLWSQYRTMIYIAIVVMFLGGVWLHGRHYGKESMIPEVEEAKSEVVKWQKVSDNYKIAIEAQNKSIERMSAESEGRIQALKDNASKAIMEGQKFRKQAENRAKEIHDLKLSGSECDRLIQLIDEVRE